MNIGIDLDGTAWEHREIFKELIIGLKLRGHKIVILTAHTNLKDADLSLWARRGFPQVDDYVSKVPGEENISSLSWKLAKAREHNLNYIFDDFDTGEVKLVRIE